MVQFCIVHKYGIEAYPEEYNKGFAFWDTISDNFISFEGEQLFEDMEDFLLWAENNPELERYTGKIPPEFGGENNGKIVQDNSSSVQTRDI